MMKQEKSKKEECIVSKTREYFKMIIGNEYLANI